MTQMERVMLFNAGLVAAEIIAQGDRDALVVFADRVDPALGRAARLLRKAVNRRCVVAEQSASRELAAAAGYRRR